MYAVYIKAIDLKCQPKKGCLLYEVFTPHRDTESIWSINTVLMKSTVQYFVHFLFKGAGRMISTIILHTDTNCICIMLLYQ